MTHRVDDLVQPRAGRRRAKRSLAALVAAGLVLAACGDDSSDNDAGDNDAGTETTAAAATDTTAGGEATATTDVGGAEPPTGASDPDATLTFTYSLGLNSFDPDLAPFPFNLTYMRPVYDTLIVRAEDGTLQPGLATEWEFDEDGALILTLREGVTFHDGTTFDAEAVKANLERTKTIEGGTSQALVASITDVEVIDPTTVKINTGEGAGPLLAVLSFYPGVMISPAAFEEDLDAIAVGTGPYMLENNDQDIEVSYVPFPDSWQPEEAAAGRLVINNQPDAGQRLNQIKAGDSDSTLTDPNLVADAEASGMQVLANPADNMWIVNLNTTGALSNPDARRAINLALDREALVEGLDFGFGDVASQITPAGQPGYNPDVQPVYDPDEARALAESSGLSSETLVFLGSAIPTITGYQEAIQAMLGDAGINVEILSVERAQTTDELASGNWDMYMNFYPGSADPWISYNATFGESSPVFPGELPADVAALLADGANTLDPDERTAIFEELAAAVDAEALTAILAHPRRPLIAAADVTGFNGNVHAIPQLRGTGIAAG